MPAVSLIFKEKNPINYEKDGFLWTKTIRKHYKFIDFLKDIIKDKCPKNLNIINLSDAKNVKTNSGSRGLYILTNMVLPFN